jgi:hypothetical protein
MTQRAGGTLETLVQTHLEALHTSSRLSSHFREHHQHPMAIDITPEQVIDVLHQAGIKCVLMGTHAINTYRDQARATQDVDVLVRKKDVSRAIRMLQEAFPGLTLKDTKVVARFVDPATAKVVVDLMKPTQKVFQMVFRHTVAVGDTHLIPSLEMALVSKFAAMTSPFRDRLRKMQDTVDFGFVVEHSKEAIDMAKLTRLAEVVYPGGSAEIKKLVEDFLAGRPIVI